MGQYHVIINLDKGEYIHPHRLGDGLKWAEQAGSEEGTMAAVWGAITCPQPRGGGDPGKHPWVGRWHGDRVVMVGDYAEDSDRPDVPQWSGLYQRCQPPEDFPEAIADMRARLDPDNPYNTYAETPEWIDAVEAAGPFTDMSPMAREFLAAEFGLVFDGTTGWISRHRRGDTESMSALAPDMILTVER